METDTTASCSVHSNCPCVSSMPRRLPIRSAKRYSPLGLARPNPEYLVAPIKLRENIWCKEFPWWTISVLLSTWTVPRAECLPINPIRCSADAGLHRSIRIPFTFRTCTTVHFIRVNPIVRPRRVVVRILRSPRYYGPRWQVKPKHRCESGINVRLDKRLSVIWEAICLRGKPSIRRRWNKGMRCNRIPNLSIPSRTFDHLRGH